MDHAREIADLEEEQMVLYHVVQDCYTLGRFWQHVPGVAEEHDTARARMREIRERLEDLLGMMMGG